MHESGLSGNDFGRKIFPDDMEELLFYEMEDRKNTVVDLEKQEYWSEGIAFYLCRRYGIIIESASPQKYVKKLLVGINYNKKTKEHKCMIEPFVKY